MGTDVTHFLAFVNVLEYYLGRRKSHDLVEHNFRFSAQKPLPCFHLDEIQSHQHIGNCDLPTQRWDKPHRVDPN